MGLLIFAAIVVSMDILLGVVLMVRASRWVDDWMSKKEESYLYGPQGKESQ